MSLPGMPMRVSWKEPFCREDFTNRCRGYMEIGSNWIRVLGYYAVLMEKQLKKTDNKTETGVTCRSYRCLAGNEGMDMNIEATPNVVVLWGLL